MVVAVTPEARLNDFYARVERQSLHPLWLGRDPAAEPSRTVRPWLWPWSVLRTNMLEAADIMPVAEDGGADRRVLTMVNPSRQGGHGATRTLLGAVQLVKPGERAPSHRHSPAALRFIIEGHGGYTIVEGEPLTMEPGDFLLTPSWTWHGHGHDGTEPMLWLDVLDVPLVSSLDVAFFEEYAQPRQLQPSQKAPDDNLRLFGGGAVLPTWTGRPQTPYSPLFSFKYGPTRESLYRLVDQAPGPFEGYALRYVNPFTGGSVMPTIGASIHLLTRGLRTQAARTTTNAIYHVVEGRGTSVLDGQRFDWQRGDTFCVPAWCWAEHAASASEDAILFAASDRPAIEALGLYREQALPEEHQEVVSEFTPPV